MDLKTAVLRCGEGLTSTEIVSKLAETVEVSRDSTPYTWSGVSIKLMQAGLSAEQIDGLIAGLPSVTGGMTIDASLRSGGVDFSLAPIQAGLDDIGVSMGANGAAIVSALKSIGVTHGARWQSWGLDSLPSVQDVQSALDSISVANWASTIQNEIINPMLVQNKTKAEIIAAIQVS